MDPADIEKFWHRAKWYATKKGYPNQAEDFAQEVSMVYISGKRFKLEWQFIDFLRRTRGIVGGKKNEPMNCLNIDLPIKEKWSLSRYVPGLPKTPEDILIEKENTKSVMDALNLPTLTPKQDYIIKEMMKGRSQVDVSKDFGVCGSRINQILRTIKVPKRGRA